MALPRRQQRLLEAIDHQMSGADPRLAWLLGTFGPLARRAPARPRAAANPGEPVLARAAGSSRRWHLARAE